MILFEKLPFEVILASNSPRRRELLSSLGLSFSIANDLKIDESYPENISTEEIPLYIARKKALAHSPLLFWQVTIFHVYLENLTTSVRQLKC